MGWPLDMPRTPVLRYLPAAMNSYAFHPALVIRTPALPLSNYPEPAQAADWLADAAFLEALYLASPGLHAECQRWQRGELTNPQKIDKLVGALSRYRSRMSSRCTPFGLFAGCSVLPWGPSSQLDLDPTAQARHTRLDMHYLGALAAHLATQEPMRSRLHYFPNSSRYALGTELRYVEHVYASATAVPEHQISSVKTSPALERVLAASTGGQTRQALAETLLAEDQAEGPADPVEALAFVDELIAAQLLVSELEPTVTGPEFLDHLRRVLSQVDDPGAPDAQLSASRAVLDAVAVRLRALDQPGAGPHAAAAYEDIAARLLPLGVPPVAGRLFQVDLLPGVRAGATLARAHQPALLTALQVLAHLTPPSRPTRLARFAEQFAARYEEQQVPLLVALDSESGISYSDYGSQPYAPLVEDLRLPTQVATTPLAPAPLTEAQQLLAQRLRAAEQHGHYSIEVTLAEVDGLPSVGEALPPSFSVVFQVLADGLLLLEHAGGSSAVNLLGRFAHASPAIAELVHLVADTEQVRNPAVMLAEICHLPTSRTGNILQRPCLRAYELPYLAQSGAAPELRLALQHLTLRQRQGQLELHDARTGRRVIPRLASSHNYTHEALPAYQLLCDLQTQGLQASLGVSWETIAPQATFRPRLSSQGVLLLAASWQFSAADLAPLLAPAAPAAAWTDFRQCWQLPRYFTLVEGDLELLVDADQPASVTRWLDLVRRPEGCLLREFLFDPVTALVRDPAGRPYTNQFVAALLRSTACYHEVAAAAAPPAVPRTFALGSEWLYYKLYCGPRVADRLLGQVVAPLTEQLLVEGLIDQWFFIRYADPDSHLRLRLHLPDVALLGRVIALVAEALASEASSGSLWKIQTDTYQRELERYGPCTIGLSESLFYYDSRRLLARLVLPDPPGDNQPATKAGHAGWLLAARGIDELLSAFALDLPAKLAFIGAQREVFAHEFGLDKPLRLQLDARYRQHKATLRAALAAPDPTSLPLRALLPTVAQQLLARHTQGQLEVALPSLLCSYVHMLVNRAVSNRPRLHELLVYDFMARYYQGRLAGPPA
jgi:lantibiotic biosynthesis protein